jgi:hypothetical protein
MNKVVLENTLKLLRKARFDITGEEALVVHQVFAYWVNELKKLENPVKVAEPPKEEPPVQKSAKKKKEQV